MRPYRLLLVVDRQWRDPSSTVLDAPYADHSLLTVAGLLRVWNIPFDILRLDEQRLEINDFLDAALDPLYGGIVWMARPAQVSDAAHDWNALRRAVEDYGIPLLALGSHLSHPALEALLGVTFDGECVACLKPHQEPMFVRENHPMVAGMASHPIPAREHYVEGYWRIARATATDATVIATHDHFDAATVREIAPDVHAVWLGGDLSVMYSRYLPDSAPLLRRALTWVLGATCIHPWGRSAVLTMDDPGYLISSMYAWHAPSLTEAQIRDDMIARLKARRARLTINCLPGTVNDETRMIEPSWTQQYTDAFGQKQDSPAVKRGIDAGIAEGVFEVQSHGWTHMVPDLESPPGPYHDAPTDGERSENGWYAEFEDRRRGREVPASVQRFRIARSIEGLTRQFGERPIAFRVSGAKYSKSPANHTYRIAAEFGFGAMLQAHQLYLPWQAGAALVPAGGPLILTCHDYDVIHEPDHLERMCDQAEAALGGTPEFIGMSHLAAYANTAITRTAAGFALRFEAPVCRAFVDEAPRFEVMRADWYAPDIGASPGEAVTVRTGIEPTQVRLQPGLGPTHLSLA